MFHSQKYDVYPDRVVEGAYTASVTPGGGLQSNYPVSENATGDRTWSPAAEPNAFPRLTSDIPLGDALYNLSLSELQKDKRSDGALSAGAQWPGVWTRDVSYSIFLSLAIIDPDAARKSLLTKVRRDRIVQDTGTGGSWPVSSDRECWALAAWEIYLATGDRGWLAQSYSIIRNSIADDEAVALDPNDGLMRGETSFLDWRDQNHPRWMQPVDIYESKSLSTNTIFYAVYRVLAAMAKEQNLADTSWEQKADHLGKAVNENFWMPSKGFYGEYLYGPAWQTLSPRSDALGQALTMLTGLAPKTRQASLLSSVPVMEYGIPTVYPQIPDMRPYHNRAVWPFVQALWSMAAADHQDEAAVAQGLASVYRASALFLTNKENFVVETGSPVGTAINSDRQLWSVAGNLAMTYRVLFGMRLEPLGLRFAPVVPAGWGQHRSLSGFHYRDAVLSIEIKGHGSHVKSTTLDGKPAEPFLAADLKGAHSLVIELEEQGTRMPQPRQVEGAIAPATPTLQLSDGTLRWAPVEGAEHYQVYQNGRPWQRVAAGSLSLPVASGSNEPAIKTRTDYQVTAVGSDGFASFLSAPVQPIPSRKVKLGSSELGYISTDQGATQDVPLSFDVDDSGKYLVAFEYANGSDSIEDNSRCALRTLYIDAARVGPIVMPQRGKDAWTDFGRSSGQLVQLGPGHHTGVLRFEPEDLNMDGKTNAARLRAILLDRLP
ncbi:glycogen debranching protein [Acidipila sp. EB88]|uniref:MGH1-like glycoside hydrolase domain-containing protein n=1 Tax=Acidipila sp. EB88 TaxID=2305226 RepID=UPI000F6033A7|nr:glycogen debranching protein [Acidipila sp. EB88]RRA49136.1 glycogen debranching protein [Acidipila sp. EB88]